MRGYVRESDEPECANNEEELIQSNHDVLEKVVSSIESSIWSGKGFTLSEVRDAVNEQISPNEIYNYQVKRYLNQKFGDAIKFSSPLRKTNL